MFSLLGSYVISHASQYEEDALQLYSLIRGVNPERTITFRELDSALIRANLSPRTLYEHVSAGYYTKEKARLDEELGLPVKEIAGGYWQQRLVEMAKRDGKSQEVVNGIDADLDRALNSGVGLFFTKEELARSIVQIYGGGTTQRIVTETKQLPALPPPKKPTNKVPFYAKDKQEWWK